MVARFVRDEEAVGSNPATPTRKWLVKAVFGELCGLLQRTGYVFSLRFTVVIGH